MSSDALASFADALLRVHAEARAIGVFEQLARTATAVRVRLKSEARMRK